MYFSFDLNIIFKLIEHNWNWLQVIEIDLFWLTSINCNFHHCFYILIVLNSNDWIFSIGAFFPGASLGAAPPTLRLTIVQSIDSACT